MKRFKIKDVLYVKLAITFLKVRALKMTQNVSHTTTMNAFHASKLIPSTNGADASKQLTTVSLLGDTVVRSAKGDIKPKTEFVS